MRSSRSHQAFLRVVLQHKGLVALPERIVFAMHCLAEPQLMLSNISNHRLQKDAAHFPECVSLRRGQHVESMSLPRGRYHPVSLRYHISL
jgi:hypothetical protein